MTALEVRPIGGLRGSIQLPGDKSISHRSLIFNALAHGCAEITGLLNSEDVAHSASCLRALGVRIESHAGGVRVHGGGGGLTAPQQTLDCGNSGTTMRLLCGVLASQRFESLLSGDGSLRRRPMTRVVAPLREMGAHIQGEEGGRLPPLRIRGEQLKGCRHRSEVASAQVRTALLLAGLRAEGRTSIWQPAWSRDHTERMLRGMGAQLTICEDSGVEVAIEGGQTLEAIDIAVPGDVSSAAFFLVAAAAQEGAELVLRDVGLNPTRTGVIDVLRRMGAEIEVEDLRDQGVEPIGDLRVRGRGLKGVTVEGDEIPRVIDELPVLAIAASLAEGETIVRNAEELRVKESDRIESTLAMLFSLGAEAAELDDGFIVSGRSGQPLRGGGEIHARGDHRIAMAGIVGASLSSHPSRVHGAECMDVSYPGFVSALNGLRNA